MSSRTALQTLVAVSCLVASPLAAVAGPITSTDYSIDLYQGAAIGSVRIVGMGGASTAMAEGSAGAVANPAGAAIRPATSTTRWDWDVHLDSIAGLPDRDLDNDGIRSDSGITLFSGGAVVVRGRWGVAVNVTYAGKKLGEENDPQPLVASFLETRIAVARTVANDEMVVGASIYGTQFSIDIDSDEQLFSMSGVGLEAGAVYLPHLENFRIGAAAGVPVNSGNIDVAACDPNNCQGYILPSKMGVPWRTSLGAAYRFAATKWNQSLDQTFRDEQSVMVAADLVISSATDNAVGLGAFSRQDDLPSGESAVVSVRVGAEAEALPGRLRLRLGSYWEPGRVKNVDGRLHVTFGAELGAFNFKAFGERRLRLSVTGDLAQRFANGGVSIGFWH